MKNLILFILPAVLCSLHVQAQQNAYVSPAGTQYLLYTPPSYTTGTQTHPLLISLHGKGEMGTDINILTVNNPHQQPSRLIYLNRWSKSLPFIVLTPLFTPPAGELNPQWPAAYIDEVVNQVMASYRVDPSRIYVTGLSLGGTGTWNYAAAYPQKVAAIVPISGRADLTKACALKNIPAWVFHGDGDPTVTMQYSIDMINAINICKVPALYKRKLTVMHTKAHHGWSEVYNSSNGNPIYDWLLKFRKNNTTNTSPYVNAGPDRTVIMRAGAFHFYGDYFDSDGTVPTVLWKQISGTTLSLANLNTSFFRVNALQPGSYEFELTVTDNHGATSSDRVKLTVLSSTTQPVVTGLMLVNGQTNAVVMRITEGMTINKAQLGLSQINIRADVSPGTNSVRFTVNADQHVRTINSPSPLVIKSPSSSSPEWQIMPGHYVVCATAHSSLGASGAGCASCFKFKVVDEINIAGCTGYGKIYREIWPGVNGTNVSDIPLAKVPAAKTELYVFESPTDVWDNFGERISGYICPPATGNYTFWISSNDNSELWLSTNSTAASKVKIASVNGSTSVRQWTKYPSQKSVSIPLTAGTKYYIEALHKEGIESDHLAVGWQLPDGTQEMPIPGRRLIPTLSGAQEAVEEVIDDRFPEDELTIYPNPGKRDDKVFVIQREGKPFNEPVRKIEIISLTGQSIRNQDIICDGCNSLELELDGISPGIYILHVVSTRGRVVKRLIVQ